MGANKKKQMKHFAPGWEDELWRSVCAMNSGNGAAWQLALAAIAITGCRPASLEHGIEFKIVRENMSMYMEALIRGVKVTADRGQTEYRFRWHGAHTHRQEEFGTIARAVAAAPNQRLTIQYDAEAISTRLREVSGKLWPRRKYRITAYCYRQLFSSAAKAANATAAELAVALGHRSTESQGRYARANKASRTGKKPWTKVEGAQPVRAHRSPMARFKAASARKKAFKLQ